MYINIAISTDFIDVSNECLWESYAATCEIYVAYAGIIE